MRTFQPLSLVVSIAIFSVMGLTTFPSAVAAENAGSLDSAFAPLISDDLDGELYIQEVVEQPDGKIIIGGYFSKVNGDPAVALARLNSDGTTDTSFNSAGVGFTDGVEALALQPDGKILVGGGGRSVNYLARLNADGSPDTTFMTNKGSGANFNVNSIALQVDGKILLGGYFTTLDGQTSNRIARLDADGTPDTTFTTNVGTGFSSSVQSLVVQSNGKIVVGGEFETLNGATVNKVARLNADGTPDATFTANNVGLGGSRPYVFGLGIQEDDKILVGGSFNTMDGHPANNISRLNADGSVDTDFGVNIGSGVDNIVSSFAVQSNGKIIVGGYFITIDSIAASKLARLNSDGSPDTSFINNLGTGFGPDQVLAVAVQMNGGILVGGNYTQFDGEATPYLARLYGDASASTGTAATSPMWLQSIGRDSATATCPVGYSGSWDMWPNGGRGGFVCNKFVVAYGN